jgi:uncharacterized repeat protein (TIGR04076 family)
MASCKITVLKCTFHQDLFDAFATAEAAQQAGPCPLFQEGQEFVLDLPWAIPEGFCNWAWADMRPCVYAACLGADLPGAKSSGTFITCCTDGFRPVIFKVERVE